MQNPTVWNFGEAKAGRVKCGFCVTKGRYRNVSIHED